VKALVWEGVNEVAVQDVPDPRLRNRQDAILKVNLSSVCGSDLHQLSGYIPFMRAGDVIGHEFLGEIVEVGPDVRRHRVGDRVVVCPAITEGMWGYHSGGIFGYSHAMGGFTGSHAEYVRVPFADQIAFQVPDGLDDMTALFASDSAPTGWMGADLGGVRPGDVVAVWGCGGVGQMAAQAAVLLGAERVIAIDRFDYRLEMTRRELGVEVLDYERTDVDAELRERTGGRGPDLCIEAVGLEAHAPGPQYRYDKAKQQLRLETDRPHAVRGADLGGVRPGDVVAVWGCGGVGQMAALGALMNKGLTLRAAQQHGPRYIPMLLERMARGELKTAHLATHPMPLDDGPRGYDLFKNKRDGCVRAVFRPSA
jgi:threonine dehydrogenase-like Zn-dependent dehydrogenase